MRPLSRYRAAISLDYSDKSAEPPIVSAKGENLIADYMVNTARRFGVPVVEKPEIVRALSEFEVDDKIPETLYRAVAVILHELDRAVGRAPPNRFS